MTCYWVRAPHAHLSEAKSEHGMRSAAEPEGKFKPKSLQVKGIQREKPDTQGRQLWQAWIKGEHRPSTKNQESGLKKTKE